ncbi:MAG TPA: DUF6786 family protein [Bacteroidales bacterium]|nr:DUF6786 family protein [Bacteroidales bacterium]
MKKISLNYGAVILVMILVVSGGCGNRSEKKPNEMQKEYLKGTYGYDAGFFRKQKINFIELKDSTSGAYVLVVPGYQGRVMTSSSGGYEGKSYGWINYKHIESGKLSDQFNPFGGEERFWLGPEGGPFSIYFRKGDEQVFPNWKVPAQLDTESFDLVSMDDGKASFKKDFTLANASGTIMTIGVERNIMLLGRTDAGTILKTDVDPGLSFVAYETENTLINKGKNIWNASEGFLSIWLLGMFNPSERGIVFIPFTPVKGKFLTDDYFGKVPADRLIVKDSILFFRVDGKHRSKIGISPDAAKSLCGSYDPDSKTLTILWLSLPETRMPYANSKWGKQDDPLKGDAVNSYNDGPVEDGSIMGPFYEIESSSPAALLPVGGSITHTQRIFHISGDEAKLSLITQKLFGVSIEAIKGMF